MKKLYSIVLGVVLLIAAFTWIPGYGQTTQKLVSINLKDARLTQALDEINSKTGNQVLYKLEEVSKETKLITLNLKDVSPVKCVEACLAGTGFTHSVQGDVIVVQPKGESQRQPQQPAKHILKGIVTDVSGKPVEEATVVIKGTTKGVATDSKGFYEIETPLNATICYSCVGKKNLEIRMKGEKDLNIILEEAEAEVTEVVVTGMFERRKESFTGSALTFSNEKLKLYGNQNIIASLKNLDPSFIVQESVEFGSDPNRMPDMRIRGTTSLKGDYEGNPNQPLFILDGFQATATQIFDLDMNRVAWVTILKDAAAKAIYGSKAANGVVVVETILPKMGKLKATYTGDININAPDLTSYNLANAAEKLQIELGAGRFTRTSIDQQQFMKEQYNALLSEVERGVNTYWLSKPLRVGIGQKHSLHLEGGDPAMRYSIDFAYNNVAGVMKGSDRETVSGAINLSYRYKDIIFRNMLNVAFNRADDSPYGSFSDFSRLNPYWTEYDENGNLKRFLGSYSTPGSGGTTTNYANPLYNATVGTKNFSKYAQITENFYAEWQAIKNLKIIGRFGFTYNNDSREDFYPGDHTRFNDWTGEDYFKRGSYSISNGESKSVNASITSNYTGVFGSHMILANVGWNLATTSNIAHGMTAQGFLNNRVDDITFARQYQENGRPSGSESVTRELGVIGAVNYSYDDRYLADLSLRTSASSMFGANNRWGTFWSVGMGWNIHREKFLLKSKVINLLKLRGSTGYTGNQNFNPFQAMRTYQFFTDRLYDNISGSYLMALVNDNLQWQQTHDINGGIDLGMFKRLNIRFDAYVNTTNNMLIDYTLPSSTGFTSYKENLGEVENKGFDVTASYMVYRNPEKDAFFSINASAAHNVNKLKKISSALTNSNEEQIDNVGTSPLTLYKEGQSLSVIWAVKSLGIDPITGQELYMKKDGTTTYTWDPLDQIVAGDASPKINGNIGFSSEYKGFGLALSFRYSWGGDYYNSTLVNRVENIDVAYNVDKRVLTSTWHNPGDMVAYRRISTNQTSTRPTTRFVEKQNEVSLSSLSLSYDFKHLNIQKYKIDRLKLMLYMNDVFRISTVEAERGLSYPFARSFSFSLNATF